MELLRKTPPKLNIIFNTNKITYNLGIYHCHMNTCDIKHNDFAHFMPVSHVNAGHTNFCGKISVEIECSP